MPFFTQLSNLLLGAANIYSNIETAGLQADTAQTNAQTTAATTIATSSNKTKILIYGVVALIALVLVLKMFKE